VRRQHPDHEWRKWCAGLSDRALMALAACMLAPQVGRCLLCDMATCTCHPNRRAYAVHVLETRAGSIVANRTLREHALLARGGKW